MDLEDIQQLLTDFSTKLELVEVAKKKCHDVIYDLIKKNNGNLEKIGSFEPTELVFEFNKQTFVFNIYYTDVPFIRTEIGIYIKDPDNVWVRGLEPVGTYELDTDLDGEHIDDMLDIHKTKKDTL